MRKKELRMRTSFETNRLAHTYLPQAYETLISTVKCVINPDKEEINIPEKSIIRQLKGNLK